MVPCINQVTTLGTPFEQDLSSYSRAGWTAVEIWLTKLETYLETHTVAEARRQLDENGLTAPGASSQGGLLTTNPGSREAHWGHFRRRLEWLQALGTTTLVITPDFAVEPSSAELSQAIASLTEAATVARPYGVRLALEPQKHSKFCASLDTTLAVVAQAGAENLGVCLDLFHFYTGPSKFEDLAFLTLENLAWVQLCDLSGVPREVAGDSDRILPGEGDFQILPILEHLARIGYAGAVSVEVLNPTLWTIPADRVADAASRSLARLLGELSPAAPTSGGR